MPPHCSANNKHTTAGTSTAVPAKSSLNTLRSIVNPSSRSLLTCKNIKIATIAAPPIGKFTQKHHRQLTRSVNTPPNNGPATLATPHMAPTNPNAIGRCLSGSVKLKITTLPENNPAVPTPATARPTMNASLDGASAHTRLPTSKRKMAPRKTALTENMR